MLVPGDWEETPTMTEQLRQVVEQLEQLPADAQDRLAAIIQAQLEDLEEQEWEAIVSKPQVRQAVRRLAAEARRQEEAGETEEGGWKV
jgi:hypothetical protein